MRPQPPTVSRLGLLRGAALSLFITTPGPAWSDDTGLAGAVRRAVVRSAQLADQADSVWQQLAGEVVPAWQPPQPLQSSPPAALDHEFADGLLAAPIEVGARCASTTPRLLLDRLPAQRRAATLLYESAGAEYRPLQNEPLYQSSSALPAGAAVRGFSRSLAEAGDDADFSEPTIFGFEAYTRWRVLQEALSDSVSDGVERRRLQRCFFQGLGDALLAGPLRDATSSPETSVRPDAPRAQKSLRAAVKGCGALLETMRAKGLLSSYTTQLTLGSGTDLFDEDDWRDGGSTSWQYIVSGSNLVGPSQLAQDRTAATGRGAGLYPGQLITAPIAAYLRQRGIVARVDEYFLDNRVGRPDPRTFSDPRYYSEVLLEIVALEEGASV